ncbi:proline/glycine betaine ABC transporter permease [Cytobacillus sp. IB215665]|uniref:ABC transporter permease n=1 Tax=Cytobacillus sp. IB215665 TaxID=3097357 RepID=UPI002A10A3C7|nr:proline/glycine betaine ABC transporter permease [Cytobacillus sp. IB215665]MDX8367720.1 proline/glycine betaine ABC transporter permease [Cytobacillus sp. IB215665]
MKMPRLPLADWVDVTVEWLTNHFEGFFESLSEGLEWLVDAIVQVLELDFVNIGGNEAISTFLLMLIFTLFAWKIGNWKLGIFTLFGLLLIDNLGYWAEMLETLSLVLTSVAISIIVGIPIGIWASQNNTVNRVITPILDLMQTMPAFVYLIPAIFFFNIGVVPGIVASVIFAMPPAIRLTTLGIKQVPNDLIEATHAFGSTTRQRLLKVQLPLAMPTIMAGVNQSIMLSLSMVVISSMVGAPGLGAEVYRAVTQIQTGMGFEAGISIVIIAIILDRLTQNIGKNKQGGRM